MIAMRQAGTHRKLSRTGSFRQRHRKIAWILGLLIAGLVLPGCHCPCAAPESPAESSRAAETAPQAPPEQTVAPAVEKAEEPAKGIADLGPGEQVRLFDGQSLGQWKVTDFGGQGDVYVKDGAIYLEMGSYATGITWGGPVVRMNYEITLEAMRVEGTDFFCALTFPVADKPCTLVLGGWGGTLCGLSNIDYYDASENPTTTFYSFKKQTWYHVRLRVVPNRITAWLDGEQLVDIDTTDRKIDIRAEMDLCQPLGIATWVTTGAIRNIFLTKLPDPVL
jgi:hypothetical protein